MAHSRSVSLQTASRYGSSTRSSYDNFVFPPRASRSSWRSLLWISGWVERSSSTRDRAFWYS